MLWYNRPVFLLAAIASATILTNAAHVASAVLHSETGKRFLLEGAVTHMSSEGVYLNDSSGGIMIMCRRMPKWKTGLSPGDVVRIAGSTHDYDLGIVFAEGESIAKIAGGPEPEIACATIDGILNGRFDYRSIKVPGTVREVFQDEIEPTVVYIKLTDGERSVYAAFQPTSSQKALAHLRRLIDTRIAAVGVCVPFNRGYRRQLGHTILLRQMPNAIQPLATPAGNPFAAPPLDSLSHSSPAKIAAMGRRRTAGCVIAVCHDGTFHVRDGSGDTHHIKPADGKPPQYGTFVEAVGFPETDLYRINLSNAVWRRAPHTPEPEKAAESTTIRKLLLDAKGRPKIAVTRHGRTVRLSGTIINVPSARERSGQMTLSDGELTIPVDISASGAGTRDLSAGYRVEVTGTCIVNTEPWNPYTSFPHATGLTLVVRRPDDIRIIARTPWWTPARLTALLAALLAVLLAFVIWNRILNRIIERRSRQLLKEEIAHAGTALKVDERTRLAVELHDSLSQTLTGVSLQIDAAEQARRKNPALTGRYLEAARRTLQSCREELRCCLRDLRDRSFEERTVAEAIRKTISPYVEGTAISIDCAIPRARLSDNTLHTLLCIIREAVTNAIRHGHASRIEIGSRLDPKTLVFTISDDGDGFDPLNHPGMADGHFGLQGMLERANRIGGALDIQSAPGKGTKISVTLRQPAAGAKPSTADQTSGNDL